MPGRGGSAAWGARWAVAALAVGAAAAARSLKEGGNEEVDGEVSAACFPWQVNLNTPCECERPPDILCSCNQDGSQSCFLGFGIPPPSRWGSGSTEEATEGGGNGEGGGTSGNVLEDAIFDAGQWFMSTGTGTVSL